MLNYKDRRYYAEFDGNDGPYLATTEYTRGDIVQFGGLLYENISDVMTTGIDPTDATVWLEIDALPELGYYQFISLKEIIDNYVVLYGDDDNHGSKPMLTKIQAFAQRAIQEFSYNIFKVQSFEVTVNDQCLIPYPQDYIDTVSLSYVDEQGEERWMVPRLNSGAPRSVITDDDVDNDSNYVYDDEGNLQYASRTSTTVENWNERPEATEQLSRGNLGYTGSYATYGKRYWQDGQADGNQNPTYVLNDEQGVIYLEPRVQGETITLRYTSDGLGGTPDEIRVPKQAEQAIYDSIYYESIVRSSKVPANEKQRAKTRMNGKRREAKLRLGTFSKRELHLILRGQANWIKT